MMANSAPSVSLRRWPVIVPFALLLVIYLPVLRDLVVDWWTDPNYSHGFLVPLVSAWLIWRRRERLSQILLQTDTSGLWVLTGGLLLFVIGNGAAEYFTVRVSFLICAVGLLWYLLGHKLVQAIWFELFFLLFMVPIPYVIYYTAAFPMQLFASKVTVTVLHAVGAGVVRQGNIIHIPGYSLEVAEACSGMRSLVSLLALGALFAHLTQRSLAAKSILFLSTIPLAVAGNVFRVFTTTVLASLVGGIVTQEPLHTLFGLSVFLVAFAGLFLFGVILKRIYP